MKNQANLEKQIRQQMQARLENLINMGNQIGGNRYDMNNYVQTWLSYNADERSLELRKNGIYQQLDTICSPEINIDLFHKMTTLFPDSLWLWRITKKFAKFFHQPVDHVSLLSTMHLILLGYFQQENNHPRCVDGDVLYKPLQCCIASTVAHKYTILFEVVFERYPIFTVHKQFCGFTFRHTIVFYDIIAHQALKSDRVENITKEYLAKSNAKDHQKVNQQQLQRILCDSISFKQILDFHLVKNDHIPLFKISFEDMSELPEAKIQLECGKYVVYVPTQFKDMQICQKSQKKFYYNEQLRIWLSIKEEVPVVRQENQNDIKIQELMDKEMFKKFTDFKSAAQLLQFIQGIPNFKFKITEQEKQVVGAPGNVLVLGRSGTGKTTCTILRLFAIELLFKLRVNLQFQNLNQFYNLSGDQIDGKAGLRCVFVTASPVLMNEVKKYYNNITSQIKEQLDKKKQKKQELERLKQLEKENPQNQQFNDLEKSQFQIINSNQELEFMEQEIKDIKVDDIKLNESSDSDFEEEEERFNKELNKFDSFDQMSFQDFPAFLTIRKLIFMIDNSLERPFMNSYRKSQIRSNLNEWHNESQGVVRIKKYEQDDDIEELKDETLQNNQDEDMDLDEQEQQAIEFERKTRLNKIFKSKNNLHSKEINYEIFLEKFWPTLFVKYKRQTKKKQFSGITPGLLWTHIYSYIKGSKNSYLFGNQHLPLAKYLQDFKDQAIDQSLLQRIYSTFQQYEIWKASGKFYDLMDVVNHDLTQLSKLNFNKRQQFKKIHFLMIDEVQDLPAAVMQLFHRVTEYNIFLCGDTAQNIAKGVGFAFRDLRSLYDGQEDTNNTKMTTFQLTTNFRSHNNILQIANSIVAMLQLFFPKTIDKLQKETSDLVGPKPVIIHSQESLFLFLKGNKQSDSIEFGSNQVIIVRNQKQKKQVPEILSHALILTIYEAKGLEFDDVILYNFFDDDEDNEDQSQWHLLQSLGVEDQLVDKEQFNNRVTKHQKLYELQQDDNDADNENENIFGYKEVDGNYIIKRLYKRPNADAINIQNCSQLCDDLKQLYVGVTRPKNKLIIYDRYPFKRQYIQKLWEKMNIVDVYTEDTIPPTLETFSVQTSKKEWKQQGIKMFKNKFFLQAMKCFNLAEEQVWEIKAKANMLAEEGTKLLTEIQDLYYVFLSRQQLKNKSTQKTQEKNKIFKEAADLFLQIKKPIQAAQCLYSAEEYSAAFKIYEEHGWIKEAAEAAYQCGQYQQAGSLFLKANDIVRALDSFELIKDWDGIYNTIKHFNDAMDIKTKQGYLNKYLPMVLTFLQDQVGQSEFQKEKTDKKNDQIIDEQEEDSEESEDDDSNNKKKDQRNQINEIYDEQNDQDEQDEQEQTQTIIIEEGQTEIQDNDPDANIDQQDLNRKDSDMEVIVSDDDQEEVQKQNKDKSESFIVNITKQSDSFQVDLKEGEYDHLGIYDLDDQWLKQDNKSIIESIQSKKSDISDFSAISYAQIQNNPNMQLVQTKGDIFIQDAVMQQIIKWISLFSEEFKQQLIQQRSKTVHLHDKNEQEIDYMVDFILDLDLVDIKFIYLVLDCLEEFKCYKLCIFVCNRYKLADKLGRYLVSLAASYSPLILEQQKIDLLVLNSLHTRRQQVEKGLVASFAVHQILQNINPEFLRIKFDNEILTTVNYLGLDSYKQLLLLGFWKKITYQMQIKEASQLCEVFLDFLNWKNIHFIKVINQLQEQIENELDKQEKSNLQGQLLICKKKQENCFKSFVTQQFYFENPVNQHQTEFTINTLEQLYLEMIAQISINDSVWRKSFMRQDQDIKILNLNIQKIKLPQFLQNSEILWNSILQNLQIPEEIIKGVYNNLTQQNVEQGGINKILFYESALFTYILLKYAIISPESEFGLQYSQIYKNKTIIMIYDMIQLLQQSLVLNHQIVNFKSQFIQRALLLLFKARIPDGDLFNNYKSSAIVQRNSILMYNVIEKTKKQTQPSINNQFYFVDIDFDFITVPSELVLDVMLKKIMNESSQLFSKRVLVLQRFYSDTKYFDDKLISSPINHNRVIKTLATTLANKAYNIVDFDGPNMNTQDGDILNRYERLEKQNEERRKLEQVANQLGSRQDEYEANEIFEILLIQNSSIINKQNILNEFLRQIIAFNNKPLKLKTVYNKILVLGLNYLQRAKQNPNKIHKDVVKGIITLNYLGLNHLSIMFLDSLVINHPNIQAYYKYMEYLVCMKYSIVSDAADCYMQYLDEYYDNVKIDEMAINLTKILTIQIISLNKQVVYLPKMLLQNLNNLISVDDKSYKLILPIHPVNEDQIYYILSYIIGYFEINQEVKQKLAILTLFTYILNIRVIPQNVVDLLSSAANYNDDFKYIMKCLKQPLEKRWEVICDDKRVIKVGYTQGKTFFKVLIENKFKSKDEIDDHYQDCLFEWENIRRQNKILEFKVSKIKRQWKLYKQTNLSQKDQIRRNPQIFNNCLEPYLNRLINKSKWVQVLEETKSIRELVFSALYGTRIDNPVDFHYISQQFFLLNVKELACYNLLVDYFQYKCIQENFLANYQQLFNEVRQFKNQFIQWQENNIKFESDMNDLLVRNRRILALKWAKQTAGINQLLIQQKKPFKQV